MTEQTERWPASARNGLGVEYPDEAGERVVTGTPPNELTAAEDRDWFGGTPWHRHVPARLEAAEARVA